MSSPVIIKLQAKFSMIKFSKSNRYKNTDPMQESKKIVKLNK